MHIITQKVLWEAKRKYFESAQALDGWYRVMKKNNFGNYADLKRTFNSVDKVNDYYVFDVGGNKLRIITNIFFTYRKIYIRYILNHNEYSKGAWK